MRSTSLILGVFATAVMAVPGQRVLQAGSSDSVSNMKDKIKTVVLMCMENRSLDNLLGGQTIRGLSTPLRDGPFCNPLNLTHPHGGQKCTEATDYNSIIDDPDHDIYGNNIEFYGNFTPDNAAIASGELTPAMMGFVDEQIRIYGTEANKTLLSQQVMNYYTEEQVPVLTALTQNFVVFNNWHSDIPGPTNPNRVALTSGTSAGAGANTFDSNSMTQRSIFQQLTESGYTWKDYTVNQSIEDALWYTWTYESNNTDLVVDISEFYTDAANGVLPDLTYINPSCCDVGTNSMHPSGLISDGETIIKDVYEALRAGPQWENTLFIITFDETGGFHDHVVPPLAVRPDNLTYTAPTPSGANYTFDFNRLGGRIPTWLISPWVDSAFVEQFGTNSNGESVSYSASSVLRTLGYLWDFEPFTPRVEQAAPVDHLIRRTKRRTPKKLPAVSQFQ